MDTNKPPMYEMTNLSWVCSCIVFTIICIVLIATGIDVPKYDRGEYSEKADKLRK